MGNTPLWGVAHAVGGWGALGLRTSPTRQVGWDPAWWMGEVRKPSAPHPPTAWATPHSGVLPTPQVGRDQLPLSHKPTASVREPLPSMTEATSMGVSTAYQLARRGWTVTVLEASPSPGSECSAVAAGGMQRSNPVLNKNSWAEVMKSWISPGALNK